MMQLAAGFDSCSQAQDHDEPECFNLHSIPKSATSQSKM